MPKQYTVLHLEDNPDITDLMKPLFADINADINVQYESARTTEEALEKLERSVPDLLIADLMLKDDHDSTTGADFIKAVYQKYPGIKIMVLSARGDQELREDLEKYIIHYETKIFRPSKYKDKILELLKKHCKTGDD